MQGFELPAGDGGRIEVDYPPGTSYRIVLAAGGLGVLALLLLLAVDLLRPRRTPPVATRRWSRGPAVVTVGLGLVALAALGGTVVTLALLTGVLLRRMPRFAAPVAGTGGLLLLVSAVAAVYSPRNGSDTPALADLAAAVAVGLLAAAAMPPGSREASDGAA
jgi:arabinofuranan 3-O-arabinosyltransferase